MRKRIWYSPPCFFVLAVEHRHFFLIRGKKQQIPRREKDYRLLFRMGLTQLSQPRFGVVFASMTAAGNEQDGNDDQPDAVVVKQIAETVIHSSSSLKW